MIVCDCEATSFDGWPIEVGLSQVREDLSIHTASSLIHHQPWMVDVAAWDPRASAIHKISRAEIVSQGRPLAAVCAWMNESCAGQLIFSDNAEYESYWLSAAFRAAGIRPLFAVAPLELAFQRSHIHPSRYGLAQVRLSFSQTPHRAAADARRLAAFYRDSLADGARPLVALAVDYPAYPLLPPQGC